MQSPFKTYPAPWQGQLLLACRKCQKKLKGNKDLEALARLKKTIKRHNRKHPETPLHLIQMSCTDLCPKDGVTACTPALGSTRLVILRSEDDIRRIAIAGKTSRLIPPSSPEEVSRRPSTLIPSANTCVA